CTNTGWVSGTYDDPNIGGSDGGDDTPVSCNAGYYAKTETGPCIKCPNADFFWAEYEDGEYFPLDKVEGTSKAGSTDIYSCYIASGSGTSKNLYMDKTGVFTLSQNCYYGS
ncbi:MAG: hypothetical protein NC133_04725, partial [Prevotella sp.]|nr:hypothetical protein [Prevotella sp.]